MAALQFLAVAANYCVTATFYVHLHSIRIIDDMKMVVRAIVLRNYLEDFSRCKPEI